MPRATLLADRDNAAALHFCQTPEFEESALAVRRRRL
jgi:hypothetical protein